MRAMTPVITSESHRPELIADEARRRRSRTGGPQPHVAASGEPIMTVSAASRLSRRYWEPADSRP